MFCVKAPVVADLQGSVVNLELCLLWTLVQPVQGGGAISIIGSQLAIAATVVVALHILMIHSPNSRNRIRNQSPQSDRRMCPHQSHNK
jgi:hypothetical protein